MSLIIVKLVLANLGAAFEEEKIQVLFLWN